MTKLDNAQGSPSARSEPEVRRGARQIDVRYRLKRDIPWIIAFASLLQAIYMLLAFRYGFDSHAYWLAWRHGLYGAPPNTPDAYLYSPAFAQLIWPLAQLPWPAFAVAYTLILLAVLAWLLKPLPLRLAIPFGVAGLNEVMAGNVFLIFALVAVLGFRYPASWAFVALTKVTPCLGPVWFLVRRDWRGLILSLGATGLVVLISLSVTPHLWMDWFHFLTTHAGDSRGAFGSLLAPPLIIRLPFGLALLVWGALREKRWTVPTAMIMATPVFGIAAITVLFALPRMYERDANHRDTPARPTQTVRSYAAPPSPED